MARADAAVFHREFCVRTVCIRLGAMEKPVSIRDGARLYSPNRLAESARDVASAGGVDDARRCVALLAQPASVSE